MRKPRKAPRFMELFPAVFRSQTDGEDGSLRIVEMISKFRGPCPAGKYLHWDELQYREPPEGLTREQWWALAKMARNSLRTPVPLLDKDGSSFSFVTVEPIPERLHEIDFRAGGRIQMPEQVSNRETRDECYVSSLIEEAITSSQLEGATTTRRVAKEMLRTGRPPRDRSERMILNNYLAMRRIGVLKTEKLTPELIFEIHRIVTDGTLDDPSAAGRFRRDDENIAVYDDRDNSLVHMPPPATELGSRLDRLCAFANQTQEPFVHPVLRSIILHFMIGYDHPFVDGNGRTARALFYWSMLRHNYWLAEFISISHIVRQAPAQYSTAYLQTETDEGDLTYFILHHLKVIMQALEALHEYIARKAEEIRRLEAELQGVEMLNHRQRGLIRHAVRHPGKRYTVEEHRRSHNVAYETARSDLLDLVERGLLKSGRMGKKLVFTPQPQLAGRLAAIGSSAPALLV